MADTVKVGRYTYQRSPPRKESGGRRSPWIDGRRVTKKELRRARALIRSELKTKEARAALAVLVRYALECDRRHDLAEEKRYHLPGAHVYWYSYDEGWCVDVKGSREKWSYYGSFQSIADALDVAALVARKQGL